MGENKSHDLLSHHRHPPSPSPPSRLLLGQRSSSSSKIPGEIVEVQGGHIVRSTGRKDRHSKVCTAKGPRDRRVRLAAHTAIQFYDVQDRLGYDRPSKAVDWLIKKAKASIDELAQLPPWHPSGCNNNAAAHGGDHGRKIQEENKSDLNAQDSSFLPPQLDSRDSIIADTIKSLFPTAAAAAGAGDSSSSPNAQIHNYDLMPISGNSQDLNLSLQSSQDPIISSMNNQQQHLSGNHVESDGNYNSFSWLDYSNQRLLHSTQSWNNTVGGIDVFGSQQQLIGHDQFFAAAQRGPLQSSNNTTAPAVHAWMDQFSTVDHHHHHQGLMVPLYHPSSSVSGIGVSGGYMGFHVPARIGGDSEDRFGGFSDNNNNNNPSSASSDSRR